MAQDVIGLLEEDHRSVRELLDELIESSDREDAMRAELLQRVERELEVHARLKEEIFYPALKQHGADGEAARRVEASEENRSIERMLLPDLKRTEPGTPEFTARIRMFREMLEHHAHSEEEGMFAQARTLLSADQLADLGQQLSVRRNQLR